MGIIEENELSKMFRLSAKQLGFAVQYLGQGTGREPDLIAIHKENGGFTVDAKAYANGYMMEASDERVSENILIITAQA